MVRFVKFQLGVAVRNLVKFDLVGGNPRGEPGAVVVYLDKVRHLVAALLEAATQLAEADSQSAVSGQHIVPDVSCCGIL